MLLQCQGITVITTLRYGLCKNIIALQSEARLHGHRHGVQGMTEVPEILPMQLLGGIVRGLKQPYSPPVKSLPA